VTSTKRIPVSPEVKQKVQIYRAKHNDVTTFDETIDRLLEEAQADD
jgi:hypothetical protein